MYQNKPNIALYIAATAFLVSICSAQFTHTVFPQPPVYRAKTLQIVDHSGNGWPDIVIGATGATDRIYRRTGAGLGLTLLYSMPLSGLTDLEVARYDTNPQKDIATSHAATNQLRVRRYPVGSQIIPLPAGFSPQKVKSIDLENDDDLDLATVGWGNAFVRLTRNNGAGIFGATFTTMTLNVSPSRPMALGVGDFNHDGKSDFIVPRADGHSSYFRNTTVGAIVSFAPAQTYSNANTRPMDVCVDDFNGDGWLDFATANSIGSCSVFLNQGPPAGGSWTSVNFTKTTYVIGTPNTFPRAISCGNYDCDGDMDIFLACSGTSKVAVLNNNGAGAFTLMPFISVGAAPMDIDAGDIDRDGWLDLATANNGGSGSVSRLLNTFPLPPKKHVYVGGITDNFGTTTPASTEHACPRPGAFTASLGARRQFDQSSCFRRFGHTFPKVSSGYQFLQRITGARLVIRLRADCASSINDSIGLGYVGSPSTPYIFRRKIIDMPGVTGYAPSTTVTLNLDLSNLPGNINLIPRLNTDRYLDIFTENGTKVDYAWLELETCQKGRCDFRIKQTPFIAGTNWTIAAGGAPAGGFIAFFLSTNVAPGMPTPGGMFCLNLPMVLLGIQFAPTGSANMTIPLPSALPTPCFTLATQALSWPTWCHSNTWTAQLFN